MSTMWACDISSVSYIVFTFLIAFLFHFLVFLDAMPLCSGVLAACAFSCAGRL